MKRYGLIGYPLTHSFSQKYFSEKFLNEQLNDHVYDNFPIKNISELKQIMTSHPDLNGLNVTIPYKKEVLDFLDEQSSAVQSIGACNCIKISNGKLSGHNTDVIGFETSLRPFLKLRDSDGRALPAQPLFATLRQPDGRVVLQQQLLMCWSN